MSGGTARASDSPPLPESTTARGVRAEGCAALYLTQHGYEILATNYRWRHGEIDIIAREGDTLCFIEVRFRRAAQHGTALCTINRSKQARIARTAEHFLSFRWRGEPPACRFDVVAFDEGSRVTLVRDAFRLGLDAG